MVHRFAEMTNALTDIGIGTFLFGGIGMRKSLLCMLCRLIGMAHLSMGFCLAGMANGLMKMRVSSRKANRWNHENPGQDQHPAHSLQC